MSEAKEKKLLECVFFSDVLCVFRKSKNVTFMHRCFWCVHYKRFEKEMEEEEEEFFEEVDKIRKYGYPKSLGDFEE